MNAAIEAMIVTSMRIVLTLMAPIAAPVRKDTLEQESHAKVNQIRLRKKQNNRSPEIIALLSDKLAKIFFLYSVTLCKSITFTDTDECNDNSHVCDANVNCTNTNGSYNCICKEEYIINGQP